MTDKQLLELIRKEDVQTRIRNEKRVGRLSDDDFVDGVMKQMPPSDHSFVVVWLIRIVALLIGIGVLVASHGHWLSVWTFWESVLSSFVGYMSHDVFSLSPLIIALDGIIFAGVVMMVCKKKHIV